jgi:hypothetical protein
MTLNNLLRPERKETPVKSLIAMATTAGGQDAGETLPGPGKRLNREIMAGGKRSA